MKITILSLAAFLIFTVGGNAQPRPADRSGATVAATSMAPASFSAKYEGGMFGFTDSESGQLKIDDANQRLVFGKDNKEMFGIPYKSLMVIYPQSRSVRSTAGTVVSHIPLPGAGLASLIRKKNRYLVLQFSDPDADARGVVNFKLSNKDLVEREIRTVGEKAKMTQRGDAYYRPRVPRSDI